MANATNRKLSYSYKGSIFKDSIEEEGMFIKYVELNKGDYVSASAYGYNMGGGSTFILE